MTVFDKEFKQTQRLSSFGRVLLTGDQIEVKTAPEVISREHYFTLQESRHTQWGKSFSYGEKTNFDPKDWCISVGQPDFFREVRSKDSQAKIAYEHALLVKLAQRGEEITLVNPSFSTMSVMQSIGEAFVTVSAGAEQSFIDSLKEFIAQKQILRFIGEREIRGTAYLGSSQVKWIPDTEFVYLAANPMYPWQEEGPCNVSLFEGKYEVTTTRKKPPKPAYNSVSVLDPNDGDYCYNPETLDNYLQRKEKMFFLRSNVRLQASQIESDEVTIHPQMLDLCGYEWISVGDDSYFVKGDKVGDVNITHGGTYYSRRNRYLLKEGYSWTPYSDWGTHRVTVFSNHPQETHLVKTVEVNQVSYVMPVEHKMVSSILQIIPPEGKGFAQADSGPYEDEVGVKYEIVSNPLKDIKLWTIVSDLGSTIVTNPRESQVVLYDVSQGQDPFDLMMNQSYFIRHGSISTWNREYYTAPHGWSPGSKVFVLGNTKELSKYVVPFMKLTKDDCRIQLYSFRGNEQLMFEASGTTIARFSSILRGTIIRDWEDTAVTVSAMADMLGLTLYQMSDLIFRTRGVYYWTISGRTSIVHMDALEIKFAGQISRDTWDGRKVSDVLNSLEEKGQLFLFSLFPDRNLVHFLRLNGAHLSFEETGQGTLMKVRSWKILRKI